MSPELEALGRRAIACDAREWLPGMLVLTTDGGRPPFRLGETHLRGGRLRGVNTKQIVRYDKSAAERGACCVPDLSDPATAGCLLALVRKAWADKCEDVWVAFTGPHWTARGRHPEFYTPHCIATGTSEADALVAALEAAP